MSDIINTVDIIHRRDPAGMLPPTIYTVPVGTNVLDWLFTEFGDYSQLCGELACSFILNGKEIYANDSEAITEANIDFSLGLHDSLVIVNRPALAGTFAGLTYATWANIAIAAISIGVSIYSYLNQPDLPGTAEAAGESPNNRLNAASNEFRPRQAIPQVFGSGISYPDFIQPSFYMYEDNIKKVYGLFCITEGEVSVSDVRVGDTSFDDLPQSSYTLFGPGEIPDAEYLVIHQSSENVDGQTLVAPDDDSVVQTYSATATALQMDGDGTTVTVTILEEVANDLNLFTDGYLYLRTEEQYEDSNEDQFFRYAIDGVFAIEDIQENASDDDYVDITFLHDWEPGQNPSDPSDFATGFFRGDVGRGDDEGVIGEGTEGTLDYWVGWFETPALEAEAIVVHLQAPNGIRGASGGKITIEMRVEIRLVDDNTALYSQDVSMRNNTLDAQFLSVEFNTDDYPGLEPGQYEVRARRLTDNFATGAAQTVKAEAYVAVTPYTVDDFGDVSLILTDRKATTFSPDTQGQKINLDYDRLLPYYNRTTGLRETDNLVATESFADAIAYTAIDRGNIDESAVNLAELYDIYDGLVSPRLGAFTFTFDDENVSMGERLESIANVARVVSWHDGTQWRFARDEEKAIASAMFNRRSVIGNDAKQTWMPQRADDSDSVQVAYVDPDENTEEYIERRFDTDTGEIITGELGDVVKVIKLTGCYDQYQASNRADLEIRRIAYQRRTVTETTYRDAFSVDLMDKVLWVDINDSDTFDGEIMGIDGDTFDTTERFTPVDGIDYFVYVTDADGYASNSVECTARDDTEFGFIASGLSDAYVASGDQQIGSRYFIASSNDAAAAEFTLSARTPSDNNTAEISLTEYDIRLYSQDPTTAPASGSIEIPSYMEVFDAEATDDAQAYIDFKSDGDITFNGYGNLLYNSWHSEAEESGVGDSYEIFVELISGTITTGTTGEWVSLSENFKLIIDKPAADDTIEAQMNITIREVGFTENSETVNVLMAAVKTSPVDLLGNQIIFDSLNEGGSRLDLTTQLKMVGSDGTEVRFAYDTGGKFYNLGNFYQILVDNVVGNLDEESSVTGSPTTIKSAGKYYVLRSEDVESVTFDLSVWNRNDPTNDIDTISVELRANS